MMKKLKEILRNLIKEERTLILLEAAFDPKDAQRIKDMFTKSKGDDSKLLQLARAMAKSIDDPMKAWRRGEAAKAAVDVPEFHNIFFDRAKELGYDGSQQNQPTSGKNAIYLPTISAMSIWKNEILGQLSDGAWENTNPPDHYKPWFEMEILKGSPKSIYHGWVKKRNYNIASLVQYVGDRMITNGKLAKALNKVLDSDEESWAEDAPKTFKEWKDMYDGLTKKTGWGMQNHFDAVGPKEAEKFYNTKYEKRDMLNDLAYIKKAMATGN